MLKKQFTLLICIILMSLGISCGYLKIRDLNLIQDQFKKSNVISGSFSGSGRQYVVYDEITLDSESQIYFDVDFQMALGELTFYIKNSNDDVVFQKSGKDIKLEDVIKLPKDNYTIAAEIIGNYEGTYRFIVKVLDA